jgi:hypothetical protein
VLDLKDPFAYLFTYVTGLKRLDKLGAKCLPELRKPASGRECDLIHKLDPPLSYSVILHLIAQ